MRRKGTPALRAAAIGTSLLIAGTSSLQTAVANGDTRTITLHHTHSGEDGTFTFKKNGRYDPDVLAKLNHFLRDWRNQKSTQMDPQLFDIVWEVYRETNASVAIQIVSSYRSPETNSMLRSRSRGVAKFSQHMLGKAMDFYIPGVNLTDLRVAGLRLQRGGVGFYPTSGSPFVHMDTGNVRHWPRMSHDQLARVFPDGKTVHVPSDGRPLANYNAAVAELQARGSKPGVAVASAGGKNFLASLFGRKDSDDEEGGAESAQAAAPETPAPAAPARDNAPRSQPGTQLASLAPLPPSRPAEIATGALLASQASAGVPVPFPQRRPSEADQERYARVASLASAMVPLPPVITRGTQAAQARGESPGASTALGYAAATTDDLMGGARFLAGGLMAQAPEETAPAASRPRGRAGGELVAGRLFLSPSISAQSYLRSPEVRSLAELMEPPHDVTPKVYAMTFSMQPRAGDVWPDLRGGFGGVVLTQRM